MLLKSEGIVLQCLREAFVGGLYVLERRWVTRKAAQALGLEAQMKIGE